MASRSGGAVLGSPISHSLSPVLHRAAYAALGLDGWDYRAVECDEAALPDTLRRLADERLAGVSLTMPLKRAVLPLLADHDDTTTAVGAANTVVFADDGWHGANTDVPGMVAALGRAGLVTLRDADAWILGAGATAAAAIVALARAGATSVRVLARRPAVAEGLRPVADRAGIALEILPWGGTDDWQRASLVVATAPAGATDGLAGALRRADGLLFDVVYAPWPTPLAAAWSAAGGPVVGGLELLVEQAAEQIRLMTGQTAPVDAMRSAGLATLG
ncbi:MAG TPA: shikimate dehydrogenase [Mycobacteriales bacterium]|nr:shikimate dehydrogenase [Mycobacteriales bacterium]